MKKSVIISISVIAAAVVATGLGVLIWWLVADNTAFETITLEGNGLGNIRHKAAFTRIPEEGNMFWWFYPSVAEGPTSRPLLLWLDGVVGVAPSLMANLGLFGPYKINFNEREDSWINDYNLLFIDAPLGTGFSTIPEGIEATSNLDDTARHLQYTLESFYSQNPEYSDAPLYIFGQGYGAQLAVFLAYAVRNNDVINTKLNGIVLGNPVIAPALVLTKLSYYLFEMGYIEVAGRKAIDEYVKIINELVINGDYEYAFEYLQKLDSFIEKDASAISVNLGQILEKLGDDANRDFYGQLEYLQDLSGFPQNWRSIMDTEVAPALGISEANYDRRRDEVLNRFSKFFMAPAVDMVENILNNTGISVTIYNSNLDAISNTLGQLEWVNKLRWSGQEQFLSSPRQTLAVDGLIEGYFRKADRLTFYWINVAGLLVPADNPAAIRSLLRRVMDE